MADVLHFRACLTNDGGFEAHARTWIPSEYCERSCTGTTRASILLLGLQGNQQKVIQMVTEALTMRINGLSPKPGKLLNKQSMISGNRHAHVSQRIGNSLCSHPALLISALGGILSVVSGW